MTERELLDALATKHSGSAWAFFTHVRNAAGFSARRTADAIAMSLWPSRGLELHGFEVKVSRGDCLRELKAPAKAEEGLYGYCDRWWIAAPADVVRLDELPSTWGLLVFKGGRWLQCKPAPRLEPKPIGRSFLAVLLRRLHEEEMQPAVIEAAVDRGRKQGEEIARARQANDSLNYESLRASVDKFEEKSGVRINDWDGARIGEAVALVLRGDHLRYRQSLEYLHNQAKQIAERINQALEGAA